MGHPDPVLDGAQGTLIMRSVSAALAEFLDAPATRPELEGYVADNVRGWTNRAIVEAVVGTRGASGVDRSLYDAVSVRCGSKVVSFASAFKACAPPYDAHGHRSWADFDLDTLRECHAAFASLQLPARVAALLDARDLAAHYALLDQGDGQPPDDYSWLDDDAGAVDDGPTIEDWAEYRPSEAPMETRPPEPSPPDAAATAPPPVAGPTVAAPPPVAPSPVVEAPPPPALDVPPAMARDAAAARALDRLRSEGEIVTPPIMRLIVGGKASAPPAASTAATTAPTAPAAPRRPRKSSGPPPAVDAATAALDAIVGRLVAIRGECKVSGATAGARSAEKALSRVRKAARLPALWVCSDCGDGDDTDPDTYCNPGEAPICLSCEGPHLDRVDAGSDVHVEALRRLGEDLIAEVELDRNGGPTPEGTAPRRLRLV